MKISDSKKDALWAATFLHYATERGGRYRSILGAEILHDAAGLANEMILLVELLPEERPTESKGGEG